MLVAPYRREIVLLVIVSALLATAARAQAPVPAGPPPGMIPEVDPAEYVLLKADVPETWTWMPPEANQEAQGTGITSEGRQETQSWWKMICEQTLIVPVTGPDNQQRPVTFTIVGTVLKSPEYAKMGWDRWLASGKPPIGLPEAMAEEWREGTSSVSYGEDSAQGLLRGKPVGVISFRYKAYVGHVAAALHEFDKPEVVAAAHRLAALLLAKITRAKLPVFNGLDVAILPEEWSFYPTRYGDKLGREPAADKQLVVAHVRNLSDKVTAQQVQVQLWVGKPGEEGSKPVGDPVTIRDLGPHRWERVNLIWPLSGTVDRAPLYVQALPLTQEDVDPGNNAVGEVVSISYAFNGSRSYSLVSDGYSFGNPNMDPNDLEQVVEAWLAALVGHAQEDPKIAEVMQRIIFPQTYTRVRNYLDSSAKMGVGGHCYGMSATSALYFGGELQRPGGDTTAALTWPAARFNIGVCHRAQMRTAMDAALSGENWHPYDEGMQKTVDAIRSSLRGPRKPLIVEFFGSVPIPGQPGKFDYPGHAVLAYKLVEWADQRCLYLYDPNFPAARLTGKAMPCFTFNMTSGGWAFPSYMPYTWARPNWVSAQPLTRTIPAGALNDLVPRFKQFLADLSKLLAEGSKLVGEGSKLLAVLRCPAEATISDDQGRTISAAGGKVSNNIPGARVLSATGAQVFLLPAGRRYSVALTRKGPGDVGFDVLHAEPGGAVGVVTFNKLPATGAVKMSVSPDGRTVTGQAGPLALSPTLTGSFDGSKIRWESGATTTATTTPIPADGRTPVVLFDNGNAARVLNRPTAPTRFTLTQPHLLTSIVTYHWNGGAGAPPAKINLEDAAGKRYGPWQAVGLAGMGGHPNCQWQVTPSVLLPAGTYTILDGGPNTWSHNAGSGGCGIAQVMGTPAGDAGSGAGPSAGPAAGATPPGAGAAQTRLTICTRLVNDAPADPGTQFTGPAAIYCFLGYQGQAAGKVVSCDWVRDGQAVLTSNQTLKGAAGWMWFNLASSDGRSLTRGNYSVKVYTSDRVLGTQAFTIN